MTDHTVAGPRPEAIDVPEAPTTGDVDVDRILSEFAAAVQWRGGTDSPVDRDDLTRHVEAAARAHRRLQDRLAPPRG